MFGKKPDKPKPPAVFQTLEEMRGGGGKGMTCPKCKCLQFADKTAVRYRKCRNCGHEFKTRETTLGQ